MRYDEYCRLHMACVAMANQSSLPHVRDRWLTMAEAWLSVATELRESGYGMTYRVSTPRLH
jgi:hypothetical protein